jgi:hypothetical protein
MIARVGAFGTKSTVDSGGRSRLAAGRLTSVVEGSSGQLDEFMHGLRDRFGLGNWKDAFERYWLLLLACYPLKRSALSDSVPDAFDQSLMFFLEVP